MSDAEDQHEIEIRTEKASIYEPDPLEPSQQPINDDRLTRVYTEGAMLPPYEPSQLWRIYEESYMRSCVDAYVTNIELQGHIFEPTVNLDAKDSEKTIRRALQMEAIFRGDAPVVTDVEIAARRLEIETASEIERLTLDLFFDYPLGDTWGTTREKTRIDLEATGNYYWEVVRSRRGGLAGIMHVPSVSMRLMPADRTMTQIKTPRRISPLAFAELSTWRRFRRFVQVIEGLPLVYFKEFGDPRIVSGKSGRYYKSMDEFRNVEPRSPIAREMIHVPLWSGLTAYGVPRWMGGVVALQGSRAAEEVNCMYFDGKTVPPMVVLVSGGKLAKGGFERITNYLAMSKGRKNFHKAIVLEAVPEAAVAGGTAPQVRLAIQPLTNAQQSDGLFQNYDERNHDKVASLFRVPRLLRGDVRDFNKATADASIAFAEAQVFAPERRRIDEVINTRLLPAMGIRFWTFKTKSPVQDDAAIRVEIMDKLRDWLTTNEGRRIIGPMLGAELGDMDPSEAPVPAPAAATKTTKGEGTIIDSLKRIRTQLAEVAKARGDEEQAEALNRQLDVETIQIPRSLFESFFEAA